MIEASAEAGLSGVGLWTSGWLGKDFKKLASECAYTGRRITLLIMEQRELVEDLQTHQKENFH